MLKAVPSAVGCGKNRLLSRDTELIPSCCYIVQWWAFLVPPSQSIRLIISFIWILVLFTLIAVIE